MNVGAGGHHTQATKLSALHTLKTGPLQNHSTTGGTLWCCVTAAGCNSTLASHVSKPQSTTAIISHDWQSSTPSPN
jgi:hypothetical protein